MAGSAFDALAAKLAGRKGVTNPRGLAASIGRKKAAAAGQPDAFNEAARKGEAMSTVLKQRRSKY